MNKTDDNSSKVDQMPADIAKNDSQSSLPFDDIVSGLVGQYKELWWSCDSSQPDLGPVYDLDEKKVRESKLVSCLDRLGEELKLASRDRPNRQALQDRLFPLAGDFLKTTFNLEDRHVTALTSYGFAESIEEFVRQARQFDPQISAQDIYQAGRNAWTMTFLQYLLGLPLKCTPAVLAFSLLYPYSDNYLDDPGIPPEVKAEFSRRFKQRLDGEPVIPASPVEEKIFDLVGMIEGQFDRQQYPYVVASLMAIYRAQVNSLRLQAPHASPYEMDVLGLAFEKGGTSVLADGYLVAGNLAPFQRSFSFYYGAFTQLMDDLEDVDRDSRDGILTIFSQTANLWPLDAVTSRLIVFGQGLLDDMTQFKVSGLAPLEEIMSKCITPLLIDSAGRIGHLYSRPYLNELERHSPYRFAMLKKVRKQVERSFSVEEVVETILRAGSQGG
jgi:hypothetical protein